MAFSGKNARVSLQPLLPVAGAVTFLTGVKWTATLRADELDVTNFNTAGQGDYVAGVHDFDFNMEGTWESNIHANPPAILPGNVYGLIVYIDAVNLPNAAFASANFIIFDVSVDAEVRGIVKFNISGKARATYPQAGTASAGNTVVTYAAPGVVVPGFTQRN